LRPGRGGPSRWSFSESRWSFHFSTYASRVVGYE
jgi:hypothetical protein